MPEPRPRQRLVVAFVLLTVLSSGLRADSRFTAATFNIENYHLVDTATRSAKPEAGRAQVALALATLHPDVVALQEVGGRPALLELQTRLREAGLSLPHAEIVHGADTNIQLALLSRFPIVGRHPHTNDSYLLEGRRHRVSRGFLEAELQITPRYRLTVLAAHLKSKRVVADAAESELREQEARLFRGKIEAILHSDPKAHLLVCGDLNDTPDSRPIRLILGQGGPRLIDTRPAEPNGDSALSENPRQRPRRVVWTHHYGVEDSFSRLDYLLLSGELAQSWRPEGTRIFVQPDWGVASDHRPILAEFVITGP